MFGLFGVLLKGRGCLSVFLFGGERVWVGWGEDFLGLKFIFGLHLYFASDLCRVSRTSSATARFGCCGSDSDTTLENIPSRESKRGKGGGIREGERQ